MPSPCDHREPALVRILAFDHFFDQDLGELRAALGPGDAIATLPYRRLHALARRSFPEAAFVGLAAASMPEHADSWRRYLPRARAFCDWLAGAYQPSVFVVPSDALFYVRPVIARFAELSVPTVVVQKETTISPMVMEEHSLAVGRNVPFISAAMTVCSNRHRAFWLRTGADPDRVVVTGQPRFDVYAGAGAGAERRSPLPTLLYLSWDDVAYLPSDTGVPWEGTWLDLRRRTEEVIGAAVEDGWRVRAKRHPQQRDGRDWLGPSVDRVAQGADTRHLILEADAVVAFQTTAVYEAAVAGRPVLYPAWGEVFERARHLLLPFAEQPELVTHARSPADLAGWLASDPRSIPGPSPGAQALAEEQLGPIDGGAAARVVNLLRGWAGGGPEAVARPSRRRLVRAQFAGAGARALAVLGPLARGGVARRSARWRQEGGEGRALRTGATHGEP